MKLFLKLLLAAIYTPKMLYMRKYSMHLPSKTFHHSIYCLFSWTDRVTKNNVWNHYYISYIFQLIALIKITYTTRRAGHTSFKVHDFVLFSKKTSSPSLLIDWSKLAKKVYKTNILNFFVFLQIIYLIAAIRKHLSLLQG